MDVISQRKLGGRHNPPFHLQGTNKIYKCYLSFERFQILVVASILALFVRTQYDCVVGNGIHPIGEIETALDVVLTHNTGVLIAIKGIVKLGGFRAEMYGALNRVASVTDG